MKGFRRLVLLSVLLAAAAGCMRVRPPVGVTPKDRVLLATGYCPCGRCCDWRRTWYGRPVYSSGPNKGRTKRVGVTASGTRAEPGTVAADTDRYPFGTVMYVEGYGYCQVEDRGGDIKGDHIDLFFRTHHEADRWGKKWVQARIWLPPPGQ